MTAHDSSPTKSTPTTFNSPRLSTESNHHHPTSPFLHNLTSRLRKGSSASSHTSGDISSAPLQDPVTKTESTRAARRAILSLVRNDWDYPSTSVNDTSEIQREPLGYRIREESQSDLEAEEVFARRRTKNDPYKFESPDSIGVHVAERKRKRRRLLDEEMQWNEGLRTWAQRRDAWTGAVAQRPREYHQQSQSSRSKRDGRLHKSRLSQSITHERNASASTDGSWPVSPSSPVPGEASSTDSSVDSPSTGTTNPNGPVGQEGPWLPIYPPLIPEEDSIRSRIKPNAYGTIYTKIVVQSLSPNVPIPLTHMIPALVEGWKAEGNWPPQPSALAPSDVKQGRSKSSAFLHWRKEHHADMRSAEAVMGNDDGKSRVRRSLGMMKKVLGAGHDDGLAELGIEFREQNDSEMEKNVTLNKGLI